MLDSCTYKFNIQAKNIVLVKIYIVVGLLPDSIYRFSRVKIETYHFHHFRIVEVIDDVLKDVSVRYESQSSEDNDDRYLLSDVRYNSYDPLTNRTLSRSLQQ